MDTTPLRRFPVVVLMLAGFITVLLGGCRESGRDRKTPAQVRAELVRLLPSKVPDRKGWAADIQEAFWALELEPSTENLCSVLAVTEQESGFNPDPPVPGLGRIALKEIERRAGAMRVPAVVVRSAMQIESPTGATWEKRIAAVRTEKELSEVFEELIDQVPMGRRLLANANPVRTAGPMQVSIAFAERHARSRDYPFAASGSIRHEVFSRRGGMYFGIAHLLGYPTSYKKPLYRFADFNAGWYASRNAAFQKALSAITRTPLDLDGDLIQPGADTPGRTELAALTLAPALELSGTDVRNALEKSNSLAFEKTDLYREVFARADEAGGRSVPRAVIPQIRLHSPKITRRLTTAWFATRVDKRYGKCMSRAQAGSR